MCRSVTCKTCGQTTWTGCGQHVEQVKARVPAAQWCPGHAVTAAGSAAQAPGGPVAVAWRSVRTILRGTRRAPGAGH